MSSELPTPPSRGPPPAPAVSGAGAVAVSPVPVVSIESETGLPKEVIRKWETRYGFPCPERDENGLRLYPADQVARLRLIRRLLGAGMRPAKIVGLNLAALERMTETVSPTTAPPEGSRQILDALTRHDIVGLRQSLKAQLTRLGLSLFVRDVVSRLNIIIGQAWLTGELRVFEEHLYTATVYDVLQEAIHTLTNYSGTPRVLLTTAPGELHTIGLLMANAVLALEEACVIRLGAETPAAEIAAAAEACGIDVVGLSFSLAHPARDGAAFLRDLTSRLDPGVETWAGGEGVARLRRIDGVRYLPDLDKIAPAIRAWKKRRGPGVEAAERSHVISD